MKSSKYTQATIQNDNDYTVYVNASTQLSHDHQLTSHLNRNLSFPNPSSKERLLNSLHRSETNANRHQDFEMCHCPIQDPLTHPKRYKPYYASEQDMVLENRAFGSMPRLEGNFSQCSLDRKSAKAHAYQNHQQKRLERGSSVKRVQSPEIINIHRAGEGVYGVENCGIKGFGCEKDFAMDEYGFRRERSFRRSGERSTMTRAHSKRRSAGDGKDKDVEDPELIFELPDHVAECQCACDSVGYAPGYTTCIQEERFLPAPDVTRRLGTSTPIAKQDPGASPPYYRSASAASSSSNSAASSKIDISSRHWWIVLAVLLLAAAAGLGVPIALKISSAASFEERLEFAARLLEETPLVDGHNDLPWNVRKFLHNRLRDFDFRSDLRNVTPWSSSAWSHTDLRRLEQGRVAAQFWAAYVPCDSQFKDAVQLTLEQIDVIRRLTEMYSPPLVLCTSSQDIETAHKEHKMCSLIGVEGGHSLAGSLAVLRTLYHVGVRYLTLTSTCNTPWADCSLADEPGKKPEHEGLTNFGKSVVKEMNRLGMIVDLSHVSINTMHDALEVSKAPVIFSHSSAHALCNSTRNVQDQTLRKLALNRGVVMINFYSKFLTCKDAATVADVVAHINHVREIAGVDNVGIGAGYDGINYVPQGLEDVSSYPTLFAELIATGKWTVDDLKKLAGLNFLRVLQEVEKVRDEFKKAKVLPYEDVLHPKPKEMINCSSQDKV